MNEPPVTIQDLMRVTGLCEASVKQGIRDGQLPGAKVGKIYVIPRGAFLAYYEGRWVARPKQLTAIPAMLHRKAS